MIFSVAEVVINDYFCKQMYFLRIISWSLIPAFHSGRILNGINQMAVAHYVNWFSPQGGAK